LTRQESFSERKRLLTLQESLQESLSERKRLLTLQESLQESLSERKRLFTLQESLFDSSQGSLSQKESLSFFLKENSSFLT